MPQKNIENSCRYCGRYVYGMCAIKKQVVYPDVDTCIAFVNKDQLSNFEQERIQDLIRSEIFSNKSSAIKNTQDNTNNIDKKTIPDGEEKYKNQQQSTTYGLKLDKEELFEMYFQSQREISVINKKIKDVNSLIRDLMEVCDDKTNNILGIVAKTLNGKDSSL